MRHTRYDYKRNKDDNQTQKPQNTRLTVHIFKDLCNNLNRKTHKGKKMFFHIKKKNRRDTRHCDLSCFRFQDGKIFGQKDSALITEKMLTASIKLKC